MKYLIAAVALAFSTPALADLSTPQITQVENMADSLCPAATRAAVHSGMSEQVAQTLVRGARNAGLNNEQIALLIKFCTVYSQGAIDAARGDFSPRT